MSKDKVVTIDPFNPPQPTVHERPDIKELPEELRAQLSKTYISGQENGDALRAALLEAAHPVALQTLDDLIVSVWQNTEKVINREKARSAVRELVKAGKLTKGGNSSYRLTPPKPKAV